MNRLMFILGLGLLILSCNKPELSEEDRRELMKEEIANRSERLLVEKRKDCFLTVVENAEAYVDSILFTEIDLDLLDTSIMPRRPVVPDRPDYIRDIDRSPIEPLFDSIPKG